jgi:cathepsin B
MKATVLGLLLGSSLCGEFLNQQALIDHINNEVSTWKSGHNHYFDGKTIEEIKHLMGTLETPEHLKLPLKEDYPNVSIPDEFFSAEQWPKCESIREVRDQSTCGSCWAFAAVEAMSDRICIASNQTLQTRISSQDLLSCCGVTCGMGCNGGFPSGAWRHFKNSGIVTGWLYNTTDWCSPYSFEPCDHHVEGRYQPCGATQKTPECVKSCIGQYPSTYP